MFGAEERNSLPMTSLTQNFPHWEKTKDLVDQLMDLMFNYRQSGHPGGSRSKAYPLLSLLLSGAMRWDIRHPEKRFGDRFILGAGHAIPLVYSILAVFNEAIRKMQHPVRARKLEGFLDQELGYKSLWKGN